jgi:hypothetical protein
MKRRDRVINYLLETSRKSPLGTNLALSIGALFCGGVCGALFAGHPNNPNMLRNTAVFDAAPVSCIDGGLTNCDSTIENSPPPYNNIVRSKTHRRQRTPATRNESSVKWEPSTEIFLNGGTVGVPSMFMAKPGGAKPWGDCANVEVWFPSKNIDMAPTMNDPNATVTFRISPPNNVFECGVWTYHYD